MSRVLSNNVSLRYAVESSLGVLPGSPIWYIVEPNTIGAYGARIETVSRAPISTTREERKGTPTRLTSSVEYQEDVTMDSAARFAEGFVFSEFANKEFDLRSATLPPPAVDGGGGNDSYTIDAATAALAAKIVYAVGGAKTLIYAKGYTNDANNGLKVIVADVASTDTAVQVATGTLVAETPPTNASLQVCGVRTDDLTLTISGSTATLVSGGDIANWATLGFMAGMIIHIGSNDGTGAVQNAYSTNTVFGYARVASISGSTLNLDKLDVNLTGGPHAPATIDVLYGRFVRNVPVGSATADNLYLERTYQFEASYPDLGGVGVPEYEYAIGNFANRMAWNIPLADKATIDFGFVGINSDDITASRKTNASTARDALRTTAVNTSSDVASISTDLISSASDVCFKSTTIALLNNVTPEECIGTFGASFVNAGTFQLTIDGQLLFTNKAIVNAIKNNTTVTMLLIFKNEDGAACIDVPTMTVSGGDREFPVGASVLVNLTGKAYKDASYGYSVGMTFLANVPTVR